MKIRESVRRAAVVCCAMLFVPCLSSASNSRSPASVPSPLVSASRAQFDQGRAIAAKAQDRYWLGEDGFPLPFRSDDEIKDFLLTAKIVEVEPIGIGITKPERVTLEKDGVRAHAAFRYFERLYQRNRLRDGRLMVNFWDSYRFEPAAYELACLLGMNNVPPAVERRVKRRKGTLQMWVYASLMESERLEQRLGPPNALRWARQRHQMILFDALIGNTDRNAGNVLIDGNWNLWLIDHTRAFYGRARYKHLEDVAFVERTFWDRLRALDREQLDAALRDYLSDTEIGRILERRLRLTASIEDLIAERGEDVVLYDARSS